MKTIIKDEISEIIIQKSRFICHIRPINSVDEGNNFIDEIKNKYSDARHNCSAMIYGTTSKCSDDGEPVGTAGVPMLESLRKNGLTNVSCVVTRYFGGIKLGAGGLIRAYSASVSDCISQATLVELISLQKITLKYKYNYSKAIERHTSNHTIFDTSYNESIVVTIGVKLDDVGSLCEQLRNAASGDIHITLGDIVSSTTSIT